MKLLPCPFCGSAEARVVTHHPRCKTVLCPCGAEGPEASKAALAAEKWNRTVDPRPSKIVSRVFDLVLEWKNNPSPGRVGQIRIELIELCEEFERLKKDRQGETVSGRTILRRAE